MKREAYLGDSVYVEINDRAQIVLTTRNGYPDDPRNEIFLEPEVLRALLEFLQAFKREAVRG